MDEAARKLDIKARLEAARERTLWLFNQVPDEFLKRRVHNFYSPIGWHFGHIGRTEEYWVVAKALQRPVLDEQLSFLLADLPENPKENRVAIPGRAELMGYLSQTRRRVLAELGDANFDSDNPLIIDGYGWEFALQHECQHQETIAEMLTLIHKASASPILATAKWPVWSSGVAEAWIDIPGGAFRMGSNDRHTYDNEKAAHEAEVAPFSAAKYPVTAHAWSDFIADGGYRNPKLWSTDGWSWRCAENAELPEYWRPVDGKFAMFGVRGPRPVHPDEPVSSVSWFEAEAFANWSGCRLLTEAEREYIASFDPDSGAPRRYPWGAEPPDDERCVNGLRAWEPGPAGAHSDGASVFGVEDLAGGVWEWTSSTFAPYPGFQAFPYDGYSLDHMKGEHRVCRGGSWATADPILRCSFRNWYVPSYRQGFLGLRLARRA
ncbi:MAG: SUMF1/EgtB/PvdO family nonheme iron enzyme [Fimbriimonadaceae bacterium]